MTKHVGDNKKIITLMLASAAVLVMYLPELFDLLRPLFSGIADGGLSYFFVFILKLAVYIAGSAAIAVSAKKYAGLSLFGRKADKLSPKYAVLIFVLTFAAVFFPAGRSISTSPSLRRSARAPRSSRRRTRFPSNIFLFVPRAVIRYGGGAFPGIFRRAVSE